MKLAPLSGRKTCDYVLRKGTEWKGKTMMIRWLPGSPKNQKIPSGSSRSSGSSGTAAIFLGTFASAKLHKSSVARNRMRRRCREAIRVFLQTYDIPASAQLLMTPKIASLDAPFEDIETDVRLFFSALPLWLKLPKNLPGSSSSRSSS